MVLLKNPLLYWRLLDKEQGECAHSPRIRTNVSKVKNK
jgi:hypothetical protein